MPPEARTAFAPGRVNLIGEHTDYNDGLCLPFATGTGITVRATPGPQTRVRAQSEGWRPYLDGVMGELGSGPAELEISGDLPAGAGLGSSGALCVALALALGGEPDDPVELARLCSRVERDRTGAQTGLLDQLASLWGREDHALELDMAKLEATPVPLALGDWALAVLDSGARHDHAASGYNERRAECREACRLLGVASLREAEPGAIAGLPEPLRARARHVHEENERVRSARAALEAGELSALADLFDASHHSLRDLYEVSLPEVERTVAAAREAGAAGARIHGGGFGGGVLALFPPGTVPPEGALRVAPGPGARLL